jgi:hypothetical protein
MYAWDSLRIIGLLCGFVFLFIAFMALQFWAGENATVPPRIIRQRSIFGSCLYSFFVACVLYTVRSNILPYETWLTLQA